MAPEAHPAEVPAPRWQARLRVAFVAFHVLAVTLLAIPAPFGAKDAAVWADAHTRAQIAGWLVPLRAVGIDATVEGVLPTIQAVGVALLDVRTALVAPFRPYAIALGTGQTWQMFATLNEEPARLEIDLRRGEDAPWTPVYRARDPRLAWRIDLLDEERTRTVINDWSWARNRASYNAFGHRIAEEVGQDFPDATSVRLIMLRAKLPEPADLAAGRSPPERETWEQIVPLSTRGSAP